MTAMLLQDLPQPLRPREKIAALGPAALTDVELLALLLRTGVKGHSVLQLAQSLLTRFQGLAGLLQATPSAPNCLRCSSCRAVPWPNKCKRAT
jgi:DNA repair protein RadC